MKPDQLLMNFIMNDPIPQLIIKCPTLEILFANNAAKLLYSHSFKDQTTIIDFHPDLEEVIKKHLSEDYFTYHDSFVINRQQYHVNFTFIKRQEEETIYYLLKIETKIHPLRRHISLRLKQYCQGNGIAMIDRELNIIDINPTYTDLFGYSRDDVIGQNFPDFLSDEDKELHVTALKNIVEGDVRRFTVLHKHKDHCYIMTSIIGVPLLIDNQIEGVQLFFKCEIPQPTFPNELFKAIINNYRDGVIVADHKGDIMWVNPAFVKITGYRFDEVYGKNPRILKSGIQTKEFYQEMWSNLLSTGHYSVELWNRKKNGNIYPQWTDCFILKDQEGNISNIISIFKDLDDVDQVNRNLLLMIQKDPMTMVYNRTYFLELMEKKLKK